MSADDDRRLGQRGQVYVTLSAAEAYAQHQHLRIEEARRELTDRLLDARCVEEAPPPGVARYRARSRTTKIDITALVTLEGRLHIVVSVHVRDGQR